MDHKRKEFRSKNGTAPQQLQINNVPTHVENTNGTN